MAHASVVNGGLIHAQARKKGRATQGTKLNAIRQTGVVTDLIAEQQSAAREGVKRANAEHLRWSR